MHIENEVKKAHFKLFITQEITLAFLSLCSQRGTTSSLEPEELILCSAAYSSALNEGWRTQHHSRGVGVGRSGLLCSKHQLPPCVSLRESEALIWRSEGAGLMLENLCSEIPNPCDIRGQANQSS